jgi:hypothetical protein
VNLLLDTSVLLAACGSASGASREVFRLREQNEWSLLVTPYILRELERNLSFLAASAHEDWARLKGGLRLVPDVLTLDRPAVFPPGKDRPVLFSALAWADVLLTLDRGDFRGVLDGTFYGLHVFKPGSFLQAERAAGRLRY